MQDLDEEGKINAPEQISALFSRMNLDAKVRFAQALAQGSKLSHHELASVVDEDDDLYSDYQEFLLCPLSFFNGTNSKNFTLFADDDYILKYEELMQVSREGDTYIRNSSVSEHIAPVYSQMELTYKNTNGEEITSYITLTKVYENHSIYEFAKSNFTKDERISTALQTFKQMTRILQKIQDEGLMFVDMKNPNWLVDADGNIFISDTKSFVKVSKDGTYQRYNPDDPQKFLQSFNYSPEEFSLGKEFSVDKAHVAIMGRNLYQYLSVCESFTLLDSSYAYPEIFNDGLGQRFKKLIESSIQRAAKARPSLQEFDEELQQIEELHTYRQQFQNDFDKLYQQQQQEFEDINLSPLFIKYGQLVLQCNNTKKMAEKIDSFTEYIEKYTECMSLLNEIEKHAVDDGDIQMITYIKSKEKEIYACENIEDYQTVINTLQKDLIVTRQSEPLINNIKRLADKYTSKNYPKGEALINTLKNVPVIERRDILTSTSESAVEMRVQIAKKKQSFSLRFPGKNPSVDELRRWIDPDIIDKAKSRQESFKQNLDSIVGNQEENPEHQSGVKNAPGNK